jgi:cytochrome P450
MNPTQPRDVPHYEADLFTDDALADPYPHLRALRDAGPVVWLDAHEMYAVARYAEVRGVLADDTTFISGEGVGLNEVVNSMGPGTTLMSDGAEHRTQREIIGRPLTPSALADLRQEGQAIADTVVERLVGQGRFDAVTDLAEVLPATWVPDLLGWPVDGRDRLLDWAAATFDGLGPMNDRAAAAGEAMLEMIAYAQQLAQTSLPDHCFAAGILRAARQGEIVASRRPMLLVDYLGPSLDTTISAIGNAIWLLATHPDQWQLLRDDPHRVKATVNEALRLESPISCFTRVAKVDTVIDRVHLPAGSRVLVSFASANRDERRWDDPESFDITRESAGQLAFGHGEHACVGMGLARLEAAAVLSALIEQTSRIELAAEPERRRNNLIRSFRSLPVVVTPA